MSYTCIVSNCILNTYTNRMSVALKLHQRRFLYIGKRPLQKSISRQNENRKRDHSGSNPRINIQQHLYTWGLEHITEEEKEINTILTSTVSWYLYMYDRNSTMKLQKFDLLNRSSIITIIVNLPTWIQDILQTSNRWRTSGINEGWE